jgi:hypothetical protein
MFVIHDEQLVKQLEQIAEQEKRPIEDVLKSFVAQYPLKSRAEKRDKSEVIRRVRQKAYAKARAYWQSVGDSEKAAMTDEELDDQFGAFDEEGIPRLKSELKLLEPPVGSLAYAAKIAENSRLHSGKPDLARRSEEILDQHFAEDFAKRIKGENAGE